MFEFTISCDEKLDLINTIYLHLKPTIESFKGIIIKQTYLHCESVCLAVDDKYTDYVKAQILDLISESIVATYKLEYLKENIAICIKNPVVFNAFIQALVVFDRQTDKDIIKKNLVLEDKIRIDSFYNFRLEQLKNRWHDIVCVVNESIPIMLKNKSVAQITRYFVDNTSKQVKEVHLFLNNNKIYIKIDNLMSDLEFDLDSDYLNDCLAEIISISPQKVIMHGKIDGLAELKHALCSVFNENVVIVNEK